MLHANFGKTRYLGTLLSLSISFLILANVIAGRLVTVGGIVFSVAEFPFPVCYLLGRVITEVYGYKQARLVTWMSLFCMVLVMIGISLCLLLPAPDFFKEDAAFKSVFSTGLRIAVAGVVALFSGDILNSYVLAKIKIWNEGKHFWFRFVVATIIAECSNTFIFFGIAFYGIWANGVLIEAILAGWAIKTGIELALLPVTYPIVSWLKKVENSDHFDRNTNFNPFLLNLED